MIKQKNKIKAKYILSLTYTVLLHKIQIGTKGIHHQNTDLISTCEGLNENDASQRLKYLIIWSALSGTV